jgi:ectopic P granules protein 5
LFCCQEFCNVQTGAPVVLNPETSSQISTQIGELRIVISILFAFVRRPAPDREFTKSLKQWLEKCVALQLRFATWQDHLFILYHVLRCPAGIPSWSSLFVQIPKSMEQQAVENRLSLFDNSVVSHTIVLLSVVLTPIKSRNEFLEKVKKKIHNYFNENDKKFFVS